MATLIGKEVVPSPALHLLDSEAETEDAACPRHDSSIRLVLGDAVEGLASLPSGMARCCVTSPPYWGLRDYDAPGQIGAEMDVSDYTDALVRVFNEVGRVLRDDGTLWLNLGDSYTSGGRTWRAPDRKNGARAMSYRPPTPAGLKPKDLIGIPWRIAFALQAAGWHLRADIIWYKPNCQPESVRDRPTQAHEYLFLLSKSERYYYDATASREPTEDGRGTRNRRSVWAISTAPNPIPHFATFPPELVERCVRSGSAPGDLVLDPFMGSGTVGLVAHALRRSFLGIEIKREYVQLAARRMGVSEAHIELAGTRAC